MNSASKVSTSSLKESFWDGLEREIEGGTHEMGGRDGLVGTHQTIATRVLDICSRLSQKLSLRLEVLTFSAEFAGNHPEA